MLIVHLTPSQGVLISCCTTLGGGILAQLRQKSGIPIYGSHLALLHYDDIFGLQVAMGKWLLQEPPSHAVKLLSQSLELLPSLSFADRLIERYALDVGRKQTIHPSASARNVEYTELFGVKIRFVYVG